MMALEETLNCDLTITLHYNSSKGGMNVCTKYNHCPLPTQHEIADKVSNKPAKLLLQY